MKKEQKRKLLEQDACYRSIRGIARWMDRYGLDPVIGLLFPTVGDILTTVMMLPFLYLSVFRIKSVPLSLAIVYNTLTDLFLSIVPFGIGDLLDFFNRAYRQNCRLIIGFVEDDNDIQKEVNRKAGWMGLCIVILLILIYVVARVSFIVLTWVWDLIAGWLA